jgi:hypothetical protein
MTLHLPLPRRRRAREPEVEFAAEVVPASPAPGSPAGETETLAWQVRLPATEFIARTPVLALPAETQAAALLHERAAAICDLLDDPGSGITRVTVTRASAALVDAIHREAIERGLVATGAMSAALGFARVVITRRPAARSTPATQRPAAGGILRQLAACLRPWRRP